MSGPNVSLERWSLIYDGKESSKFSRVEVVFLKVKNILHLLVVDLCFTLFYFWFFSVYRFHQKCCIKNRTASSRVRIIWRLASGQIPFVVTKQCNPSVEAVSDWTTSSSQSPTINSAIPMPIKQHCLQVSDVVACHIVSNERKSNLEIDVRSSRVSFDFLQCNIK